MFIPMIVCVLFLVFVKVSRERNFVSIFDGFLDTRAFRRYLREETTYSGGISNLLMLNSLVVFSLFLVYINAQVFNLKFSIPVINLWGITVGAIFIYYWVKRIIAHIVGYVSDEVTVINEYIIYNKFYLKFMGVVLLPLLFFLNFLSYDLTNPVFFYIQKWLPWGIVLLIIIGYLTKIYQGYQQCLEIKVSRYYLILYFCTLEILPLIGIYFWLVGSF
jgi:hypothetical protein